MAKNIIKSIPAKFQLVAMLFEVRPIFCGNTADYVFSFHFLFTVNASYGERLLEGQLVDSERSRILRKNAQGESRTTSEI